MQLSHACGRGFCGVRRPESRVVRRVGPGDGAGGPVRAGRARRGKASSLPEGAGVNAQLKVPALVAGMVAGADSIDDMDLLRHGGMGRLFDGVLGPVDAGVASAQLRLRSCSPTGLRRCRVAGQPRRVHPVAARRRGGRLRRHRRHDQGDLRLRQAGRGVRLLGGEGPQRAARPRCPPRPPRRWSPRPGCGAGRRTPPAARPRSWRRRWPPPGRPGPAGPTGPGWCCCGPIRPTTTPMWSPPPPGRGPVLHHRPDDPDGHRGDREHRRGCVDPDPLPERHLGRR